MALAFVHKAAAIQSHPKTALSMRPRRTLLPLEAGILTVRYRYLQGLATSCKTVLQQGVVRWAVARCVRCTSYPRTLIDLVRRMPSAAVRLALRLGGTVAAHGKKTPLAGQRAGP